MEFFNDVKIVILRVYNFILVLINCVKLLVFKYLNVIVVFCYYNVICEFMFEFYEFICDFVGKYYYKYYKIGCNYILYIYNMMCNMIFFGFYKICGLFFCGIYLMGYFNDVILFKIEKSLFNGKIMVLKYMNEIVLMLRESLYIVKVWYYENKEKILEKFMQEVYEFVECKLMEV